MDKVETVSTSEDPGKEGEMLHTGDLNAGEALLQTTVVLGPAVSGEVQLVSGSGMSPQIDKSQG
jgi:hypothetical protein